MVRRAKHLLGLAQYSMYMVGSTVSREPCTRLAEPHNLWVTLLLLALTYAALTYKCPFSDTEDAMTGASVSNAQKGRRGVPREGPASWLHAYRKKSMLCYALEGSLASAKSSEFPRVS